MTRFRVDTQVLEGPNIGNIRSLLNMLLAIDTQVLEGPIPAISGPAQHAAGRNETVERLQPYVARTTGAGSTPVVPSYDQCSFVSVRLFIV